MANNVDVFDNASVEVVFKTTDTAGVHVSHVNVDSIPLATGAATATNQTTIIGHVDGIEALLTTIDADTGGMLTALQALDNAVSGNEFQVDIVSSALPSGAATAANQATIITHVDGIETLLAAPITVRSYSPVFDVTLSTDTSAYASGDVLADSQVLTNIMRANDSTGVLQSVTMLDKADQKVAMTLYFLSSNVAMGTENAAPSISDANSLFILGYVDIAASDWKDLGGTAVASIKGIGLGLAPASGTRNVYIAAVNGTGTPTFAADSLVARLTVLQD